MQQEVSKVHNSYDKLQPGIALSGLKIIGVLRPPVQPEVLHSPKAIQLRRACPALRGVACIIKGKNIAPLRGLKSCCCSPHPVTNRGLLKSCPCRGKEALKIHFYFNYKQ